MHSCRAPPRSPSPTGALGGPYRAVGRLFLPPSRVVRHRPAPPLHIRGEPRGPLLFHAIVISTRAAEELKHPRRLQPRYPPATSGRPHRERIWGGANHGGWTGHRNYPSSSTAIDFHPHHPLHCAAALSGCTASSPPATRTPATALDATALDLRAHGKSSSHRWNPSTNRCLRTCRRSRILDASSPPHGWRPSSLRAHRRSNSVSTRCRLRAVGDQALSACAGGQALSPRAVTYGGRRSSSLCTRWRLSSRHTPSPPAAGGRAPSACDRQQRLGMDVGEMTGQE
jgi:hypothetical protein